MTVVKTCNGCRYKKRCNGKIAKNSPDCKRLRQGKLKEKQSRFSYWLRKFNGDKFTAMVKLNKTKDEDK